MATSEETEFYPPNRLAEIIQTPGGTTVAMALQKAAAALDAREDACLARIDSALGDIRSLASAQAPSLEHQARLYDLSSEIVSLAATASYRELSEAAFCFCELLDNQRQQAAWLPERVQVHLSALGLLRHPGAFSQEDRAALITGLHKLAALQ